MNIDGDEDRFHGMISVLYTPVIGIFSMGSAIRTSFFRSQSNRFSVEMRMVGRALPIQIADAWGKQDAPFGRMTEAL